MSDILTRSHLLEDAAGNILLTIKQDQTSVANAVDTIKNETKGWTDERTMKMAFSIPAQEYHEWGNKLGYECWQDDDFLSFYKNHRPEFAI